MQNAENGQGNLCLDQGKSKGKSGNFFRFVVVTLIDNVHIIENLWTKEWLKLKHLILFIEWEDYDKFHIF